MGKERFDTSLLDTTLEEQRRAWEEERRQVVARMLELLDRWGPALGIRQAYLFGSVARPGHFRPDSDVDLAMEQIAGESLFRAMACFSEELDRPVDVVELAESPFAEGTSLEAPGSG
ncbi:MAG: nucleotidyltransferase family protein [Chloroflexia bacterium]